MNVIGIDIGGSKISGIVFNGRKVIEQLTIKTPSNLFEFEKNLLKLTDFLSAGKKVQAVGIGMAGLVDQKSGTIRHSPNIKFVKNLELDKFFKLNGYPRVKIDNDASSFTRAELFLGQGKGFGNFLAFTLGTGVGGGIVINKKAYRGGYGGGAELGHIFVKGKFLEKDFQKYRDQNNYRNMGKLLGGAFASLTNIFEPQAIILGGGVSQHAGAKFLPTAKKEMHKFLFNKHRMPKILVSKLKHAGALGAALLWK